MASSLPIVTTPEANFPEVESRGAGFVVEGQAKSIAGAMNRLLESETLRQEMGSRGISLVKEEFEWSRVAERLSKAYGEFVATGEGN
jgi:glycosyltransferase involved in cell wall biosynthesis